MRKIYLAEFILLLFTSANFVFAKFPSNLKSYLNLTYSFPLTANHQPVDGDQVVLHGRHGERVHDGGVPGAGQRHRPVAGQPARVPGALDVRHPGQVHGGHPQPHRVLQQDQPHLAQVDQRYHGQDLSLSEQPV